MIIINDPISSVNMIIKDLNMNMIIIDNSISNVDVIIIDNSISNVNMIIIDNSISNVNMIIIDNFKCEHDHHR